MLIQSTRFAGAALLTAALLTPSSALAQYYRYGFGGVRVRTPGVGVNVGPYGSVRVSAPGAYIRTPGRVIAGPRAVVPGGFYYSGPGVVVRSGSTVPGAAASGGVVSSGPTTASAAGVTEAQPTLAASAAEERSLASEAELAAMSGTGLLVAISDASEALEARLNGFENGSNWQAYLALGAAAEGDLSAAEKLLRRYDSIARDSQFAMIARLEEFASVRTALRVLVDRGGVAAAVEAPAAAVETSAAATGGVSIKVQGESLPKPVADSDVDVDDVDVDDVDVNVGGGGVRVKVERSILKNR